MRPKRSPDEVRRKQKLVARAVEYCGGQKQLMDAMNAVDRLDGRRTHQTEVSRWLNEDRMVSVWDAITMHRATSGHVAYAEFYPTFKDDFKKADRIRPKALKAA